MNSQYKVCYVPSKGVYAIANLKTGKISFGRGGKGYKSPVDATSYINELVYWRVRCGY